MSIWVSRNGRQFGPYSIDDLKRMLALGQFSPVDWAWIDGGADWIPLGVAISGRPNDYAIPLQYDASQTAYPGVANGAISSLIPPDIHWVWILLLGLPTLGIFPFIWFLRMTAFVRKLDPDETPMYLTIIGFASIHAGNLFKITHSYTGPSHANAALSGSFILGGVACYVIAKFRMRRILLGHYNCVEPISLYLSGVMTFFFGTYYLQYHFSRVAQWKKTGFLKPQ